MSVHKKLLLGAVALAALVLSGCSSATSGSSPSNSAASIQGEGAASIVAKITADPSLVKLRGSKFDSITVGSSLVAPPAAYLASDGSTPTGFEVDLINAIGKRIGSKVTISNAAFQTLLTGLTAGRYDTLISEMNDTKKRQETVDFVDYYNTSVAFIVPAGKEDTITGPASLCGLTVSTLPGTSQATWVQEQNAGVCASKPMMLVQVGSESDALNNLKTGRQDVNISDTSLAAYTAASAGKGVLSAVVPKEQIEPAPYGIAISKENPSLRDAFQKALQSLIDDGTYERILKAWDVQGGAVEKAVVNGGN